MYTCQILLKLNEGHVPQVSVLHTTIQTWQHSVFWSSVEVVFTGAAERRLQWNTKYCNGIPGHCKWDVLDGIWLCPLLSLSRPTGSVRRTLVGHFFVCSLTHPRWTCRFFSDGERDSEGTILRIYIHVWSDECHVWSLILALRNTKLWVELNGPNLPSARVFFCVFQLVRINLTSGIHFYQLYQRADTAGTGRESKGIKSPMKSLSKSSYVASFLV